MGACGSVRNYSIPEICIVRGNLVCVQSIWTVRSSAFVIIILQGTISVAVGMLPLPGGMGISEQLFLRIFLPVFGSQLLLPGMLLSRGLGYYTELILSALLTIVANFTIGRNVKKG